MPLLFFGAWYVIPGVLDSDGLRWLSGIVTILWALEFYFFQRLTSVSTVDGLSSKEHERLVLRLSSLRKRVWWIGGVGLFSALSMWLLAASGLPISSPIYAAMAGVLFGISLSYLILIPGWIGESQNFVDEVKRRDAMAKKRQDAVSSMSNKQSGRS